MTHIYSENFGISYHYLCPHTWSTTLPMSSMVEALGAIPRVTIEHDGRVVGGHAMIYGVIHHCQIRYMPHITLIERLYSISVTVPSSLHHYSTGEEHDSSSLFQCPG